MNVVSPNVGPDGLPQSRPDSLSVTPRTRPDVLRGTNLQLNNFGEQVNRATEAFTRLLGEVSKAVGRYGSLQLESLGQMPMFPEPIRALMGMLSKSPEALATQLNRMVPNHANNRMLPGNLTGWVDATRSEDRALLTQLAGEIDRVRQTAGNGPVMSRFFAQLGAAIGTNTNITLAEVVNKAKTIALTVAPQAPATETTPNTPPPAVPEVRALGENEELNRNDKRTVNVPFSADVSVEGQAGKLAGSTAGSVIINGLKLTRAAGEEKITVEVTANATAGERKLKFNGETKILRVRASN